MNKISDNDPDRAKGATEAEEHHHDGNLGLSEQLGHRDQDPLHQRRRHRLPRARK